MLLDAEAAVVRLHAELVDADVVASGDGTNAIKDAFGAGLARDGVDYDVGLGQRAMCGLRGGAHQFAGVLEGVTARQRESEVSEVIGAGAADAGLLDGEHAIDLGNFSDKALAGLRGDFIHEDGDSFAAEMESHAQDHERDDDGGDGIGVAEPGDAEAQADPTGAETGKHGDGGPDVGSEVKGVRGEGGAAGALSYSAQLAGAPVIDSDGSEQNENRPDGMMQHDALAEDALHGFPDDPRAADGHEAGLEEGGEVFEFAVTVGVAFVGGLVADLHGEEGERRGDQIEGGVSCV
jgi:hypothetical protein